MIGRFLEISVHAPDLLASLGFYERLGFTQVTTGEAWPYPYAAVTDGRLGVGLHQHELPQSPLISFVLPELLKHIDALESLGIAFVSRRLGSDVFNEAAFTTPGGHMVRLLEARTFSPAARRPGDTSRLGWFEEIALPVADVAEAGRYWERLGFVQAEEGNDPYPHLGFTSDTLNVALLPPGALGGPALTFTDAAMEERIAALQAAGFDCTRTLTGASDPARHALLTAPEGTRLLLATAA